MKPVDQTTFVRDGDAGRIVGGNCVMACVASIVERPLHDPHPSRAGITEIGDYIVLIPLKAAGP